MRLWETSGEFRGLHTTHAAAVYQVAFSPDGRTLASGDSGGGVRLQAVGGPHRTDLTGHRSSVWPFAWRPDGGQLATSSNDGTVRLWDPGSGQCQRVLRGHGRRISSVRFSADGGEPPADADNFEIGGRSGRSRRGGAHRLRRCESRSRSRLAGS